MRLGAQHGRGGGGAIAMSDGGGAIVIFVLLMPTPRSGGPDSELGGQWPPPGPTSSTAPGDGSPRQVMLCYCGVITFMCIST